MPKIRRPLVAVGAGLATAVALLAATPAFANDFVSTGNSDSTPALAIQGGSATLTWTVRNDGPSVYIQKDGFVELTAPPGLSFTEQSDVPSSRSTDGVSFGATNLQLTNCQVEDLGTHMWCVIASANGQEATNWESGTYRRFEPTVAVSSDAIPGMVSGTALMQFRNNRPGTEHGIREIKTDALEAVVVASASAPVVDPAIGALGLLTILVGTLGVRRFAHDLAS